MFRTAAVRNVSPFRNRAEKLSELQHSDDRFSSVYEALAQHSEGTHSALTQRLPLLDYAHLQRVAIAIDGVFRFVF